jgi:uncharacterized caspase-like protein
MRHLHRLGAPLALAWLALTSVVSAQAAERRIGLVIGNADYQAGALATPANDAGLIAQTLEAAGFEVVGARDLDADSLRHAFQDFVDKAGAAGPDTVAFVYFAGYGLQLAGENYLAPVDAKISRDTDVPLRTLRLSDYTRSLAGLKLKAIITVLDAARANPFAIGDQPLAGGLAMMEPDPGMLIAFNAAPGTVAPEGQDYGPYAKALAEMIRQGGLAPAELFDQVRLRVNEVTKGGQVPWDASRIETQLALLERAPDAPPSPAPDQRAAIQSKPMRELGAGDGYQAAIERDNPQAYEDFLATYPDDAMAGRVRAMLAARREAITWTRTYRIDTADAYWSYLSRYPHGPHAADARRRLAHLAAALEPPPAFAAVGYDVLPPPPDEDIYMDRAVLAFYDPDFDFAPPPPPPDYVLLPPPVDFWGLPPPPPPIAAFLLPVPVFLPVQPWVVVPPYVAPPANNIFFTNIHNTVIVNNATNEVVVKNREGQIVAPAAATGGAGVAGHPPAGAPAAAAAIYRPTLPPSVARKASLIEPPGAQAPGGKPGAGPSGVKPFPGQALPGLPGTHGQPQTPPGAAGQPQPPVPGKPPLRGQTLPAPTPQPQQRANQELPQQQKAHQQEMLQQEKVQQQKIQQHQQHQNVQQQPQQQRLQRQELPAGQTQHRQVELQHEQQIRQQQHQQQQSPHPQIQQPQHQQQSPHQQTQQPQHQPQLQQHQQTQQQQHQPQPQQARTSPAQSQHPPPQRPQCGGPGLPPCPH